MRVVTNTSPLLNFAAIGQPELLTKVFGAVTAPEAVRGEFTSLRQRDPRFASAVVDSKVTFATVQNRNQVTLLSLHLDPGEAEAIALAIETNADLLLLDERRATLTAKRLGLKTLGILGVLILAKRNGLIPAVKPLLELLINQAGFWISNPLKQSVLIAAAE